MNLNVWYFTSILKNYFCYILNKTSPWKIFLNANSFPSSNKWLQLLRFQVQIKFSVLGKKGHLSFVVCITLSLGFSSSKIKIRFLIRHIFHFSFHEAKVLDLRSQVRGYSLYCHLTRSWLPVLALDFYCYCISLYYICFWCKMLQNN